MMEIERLKQIKFHEENEKYKKEEQKKGHAEIIGQIKERDLVRLRNREEQEIEGQIMLRELKKMQEEEGVESIVKDEFSFRIKNITKRSFKIKYLKQIRRQF